MSTLNDHLIARVREALATDPRTHTLGLDVEVRATCLVVRGPVATAARRDAVATVVREHAPLDLELLNETWVVCHAPPREGTAVEELE